MKKLNSDKDVSRIRIEGNIPFVNSDDISLVLVDTPGPNNSRNSDHKETTYKILSESSKAVVLYVLNATQFGTNDDNHLLSIVADSMKVGGKQSRDRFIFVVNKLDEFKKDEDNVESLLQNVRDYLADRGIENPNIYPASALTALDIRTILAESDDDDDDDVYKAKGNVRKLNKNEELHLEKYAPLPTSVMEKINNRLNEAVKKGDLNEQALIHSGIVSIEEAIRMYVMKYAKTAKIKNVADTFTARIESANAFERTKLQIADNKNRSTEIIKSIDSIEAKLKSGEEAKKFKKRIEELDYKKDIEHGVTKILSKSQKMLTDYLSDTKDTNNKLTREEAEDICKEYAELADDILVKEKVYLENLISNAVQKNAKYLLGLYKVKLRDLAKDMNIRDIELDTYNIMSGEIPSYDIESLIVGSSKTEQVKVGETWIENTDKKWYKPWTWFQSSGYYKDIMGDHEYIDKQTLSEQFFAPIEEQLYANSQNSKKYAEEQTKKIKKDFLSKFNDLDKVLKKKLDELKSYATDMEYTEKKLADLKFKLKWLEGIQNRINEILDI